MNKQLSFMEKLTYGLGAVGKDMVYMLSASYILYYYQDIMGVSAWAMGIILLVARVFDAFNDPVMGILVAKTKTKYGKFRPWLMIGTLTNAVSSAAAGSVIGLRMTMTILPIIVLVIGVYVFKKKYILTDEKLEEISNELKAKQA